MYQLHVTNPLDPVLSDQRKRPCLVDSKPPREFAAAVTL
jgi:hypothetical protein